MIIEPKLIDRNRDEITIDKDNAVINSPELFLHYRRNDNGNFNIIYTKNNIGAKSFYNNQIWVLLNQNKDTIYQVLSNQTLELDSIIDIYKVKNNSKRQSYLCIVSEILTKDENIDTLGIIINPQSLEPLFVYSVNNNEIKPVITPNEAQEIYGCPISTNYRLKYTIEQFIPNQNLIKKSSKERCEILERVIKKA